MADPVQLDEAGFRAALAARFVAKSDMTIDQAEPYARDVLNEHLASEGIAFGDPGHAWDPDTAEFLADEEMSYWGEG